MNIILIRKLLRILWVIGCLYLLALSIYYKTWVPAAFAGWVILVGYVFRKLDKRKPSINSRH